jgi:hypothetical protein
MFRRSEVPPSEKSRVVQTSNRRADDEFMRLARYAWWLPVVLALGGFVLIHVNAYCTYPVGYYGWDSLQRCTIRFLGMDLSENAAGWLAAGIGGVLGWALALILSGTTARWTWPSVRRWIARVGLVIAGAGILVVGVVAAVSWFEFHAPRSTPKTWVVELGGTLRVPADEVLAEDSWECKDWAKWGETPPPGEEIIAREVFSLKVDRAGNVTFHCEPDPPGHV